MDEIERQLHAWGDATAAPDADAISADEVMAGHHVTLGWGAALAQHRYWLAAAAVIVLLVATAVVVATTGPGGNSGSTKVRTAGSGTSMETTSTVRTSTTNLSPATTATTTSTMTSPTTTTSPGNTTTTPNTTSPSAPPTPTTSPTPTSPPAPKAPTPPTAPPVAPAGPISVTFTLNSRTVAAGGSLTGIVTVTNGGSPAPITKCGVVFVLYLEGDGAEQQVILPACAEPFEIPSGTSTYAVSLVATYSTCTNSTPTPDTPPCADGGTPPGLPAGEYRARIGGPGVVGRPPSPITVTVT